MTGKSLSLIVLLFSILIHPVTSAEEAIKIYSTHEADTIQPQLDRFTQTSGIKTELISDTSASLFKRLQTETGATAADLFFGASAIEMQQAKNTGVLQSVSSELLTTAVPYSYRDAEHFWYGLSMTVRPVLYVKSKIDPFEFYGYEEMAKPEWKGRICVSSAENISNQSLVASMIISRGKEATQKWLASFVGNLARPAQGNDLDQLVAIASGKCELTLADTSLYGQLAASEDEAEKKLVAGLGLLWTNQPGRGVHANFKGVAVTKHAPHKDNALKLLEFLFTEDSQLWFANHNFEYPVIDITWTDTLRRWGRFKSDSKNMPGLETQNQTAITLMQEAGWK